MNQSYPLNGLSLNTWIWYCSICQTSHYGSVQGGSGCILNRATQVPVPTDLRPKELFVSRPAGGGPITVTLDGKQFILNTDQARDLRNRLDIVLK